MKHENKAGIVLATAVSAVMIASLSAAPKCTVLPVIATSQQIKVEKIKLLAEHTQDRVEIDGRSQLKDDQLDEEIRRRAFGYTSANEIDVHRSDTAVRVCLAAPNKSTQPGKGEN